MGKSESNKSIELNHIPNFRNFILIFSGAKELLLILSLLGLSLQIVKDKCWVYLGF